MSSLIAPSTAPEPQSRMRRLGRLAGTRFPRTSRLMLAVGRAIFILFGIVAIGLTLGGAWAALMAGAEQFKKQGWTPDVVVGAVLGLLLLLFEWLVSWPAYVWLGLIAVFWLSRIGSQLEQLGARMSTLEDRMLALTAAVRAEDDDDNGSG